MPYLNPVTEYQPLDPYYYLFDNIPIEGLVKRTDTLNQYVDANTLEIEAARGTAGSLALRLNTSLSDTGALIASSINDALHNIGYHIDGFGPDSVEYVRMMMSEREKLGMIQDSANSLNVSVQTGISEVVVFDNGSVEFVPSASCDWRVIPPNKIQANLHFPLESAHRHYYGVVPVSVSLTPDYVNYLTGISQAFMNGSLRVYVNGVRLEEGVSIPIPSYSGLGASVLNSYTSDVNGLGFSFTDPVTAYDVVRIDFDISLAENP